MDIKKILSSVDHTNLLQAAIFSDIQSLCDDAIKYKTACVCIAPCFVKDAREYVKGAMRICTVIGFPNGYNKTKVKVNETAYALSDGADEIDMVINIGDLKNKNYGRITDEIMSVKHECGDKILKVIIETALLTDDEKIMMCNIISDTQADFIKTSTGFAGAGACIQDIALFKKYLSKEVKIKASGGIKTIEDARGFLEAGCSRIGASSLINLI